MTLQEIKGCQDSNQLSTEKRNLENLLNDTDYKVLKCYEATVLNQPLPYDMEEVHNLRQDARDKINAIDEKVEELNNTESEVVENIQ